MKCIILSGIPCSGKSTWAKKKGIPIISCDIIREDLFGIDYKFTTDNEKVVWNTFYEKIRLFTSDFIVDNTNCRKIYIDRIKECLDKNCSIQIRHFHISLTKAYYRNIKRWILTGKYIPFKVIKNMQKNYKKLWLHN